MDNSVTRQLSGHAVYFVLVSSYHAASSAFKTILRAVFTKALVLLIDYAHMLHPSAVTTGQKRLLGLRLFFSFQQKSRRDAFAN